MKNEQTIEITDELIARYLAGQASPEEAIALHAWLESRGHREHFEKTERVWHQTHPSKSPRATDSQAAWHSVQARVGGNRHSIAFPEAKTRRSALRMVMQIAASAFILLGRGIRRLFSFIRQGCAAGYACYSPASRRTHTTRPIACDLEPPQQDPICA